MASIISANIDLTKIDKSKITKVKKVSIIQLLLFLMMNLVNTVTQGIFKQNKLKKSAMLNSLKAI